MYEVSKDDRTWGMLSHLLALCGYIGVPFGNILAPLIIWLVKKDQSQFVADQAKESLNFQISLTIYAIVSGILVLVLIGFLLLGVVIIGGAILTIIATIKANNGEYYRYPLTLRLVK
ncbi:MAG: DUF4870 domain-containing protein [Acidobacteriota bacterium]|nr:DUF4870 domain-containing protein [Acidobacteriota bacterium]